MSWYIFLLLPAPHSFAVTYHYCRSNPLSLPGSTTLVPFTLVFLLLAWTASTAFCALLPVWLVGYLNLTIFLPICGMSSIGSLWGSALSSRSPVAGLVCARSTRCLRSAEQGLLHVPFARTFTMQSWTFSVVGPLVWNGLPLALRSLPRVFSQKFLQQLKTTLFGPAGVGSASE